MKKFKLKGTNGREVFGNYLGIQVASIPTLNYNVDKKPANFIWSIPLPNIVNETQMYIIYTDDDDCIFHEPIDAGDQIEFL